MAHAARFLLAFALFVASASPTVSFEDTGELVAAVVSLGVTHPPGYPWLTMLGALAQTASVGDPAFRMAMLSAAFGALAVALAGWLAVGLAPDDRTRRWAPWMASGLLAFSKTLWWQASIADKYTLSLSLMLLGALALLRALRTDLGRDRLAAVFLCAAALSHHWHGLYLLPACGLILWPWRESPRRLALAALVAAVPLAGKSLAIPIRARASPAINWGVPDRLDRLTAYLTARQYRFIMLANKGGKDIAGRALEQATSVPYREFGPALILLIPGWIVLAGSSPAVAAGALLVLATNGALAVAYNTPEIERYYLLSYAVLAAIMGLGAARLAAMRPAFGVVASLLLLVPMRAHARTSPRNRHYLAHDFAYNQLAPLPRGAILICEGDDQAFPLFYLNGVAGFRDDVHLVPMPFACWRPSYARMAAANPDLNFPRFISDPGRHLPAIIAANAPRRAFYTPGCTGAGSDRHLTPRGAVFEAFSDPAATAAARARVGRRPRLRLRGAANAERYGDAVTLRAVRHYGFALAFHGAQELERGRHAEAMAALRRAVRLPMEPVPRAAAQTHLGMALAGTGRPDLAEASYARALDAVPDFAPALFEFGMLLVRTGRRHRGHALLIRATHDPRYLTGRQRRILVKLLGTP